MKLPLSDDVELDVIKREADLWAQVSGHTNVLPIIEADVYGDHVIIASEYAPDGSLDTWLARHGGRAPSLEAAVTMTNGILTGLEHLHEQSIIHRDLKPANILLQKGTPRLSDFGISRVLRTTSHDSAVAGTPAYMAPEAFDGKRSQQADLWSVGVILYQLTCGELPFPQKDMASLLGGIFTRGLEFPSTIPIPVKHVIERALEKNPKDRYGSAQEMKVALNDAIQSLSTTQRLRVGNELPTLSDNVVTLRKQNEKRPTLKDSIVMGDRRFRRLAVALALVGLIVVTSLIIRSYRMSRRLDPSGMNSSPRVEDAAGQTPNPSSSREAYVAISPTPATSPSPSPSPSPRRRKAEKQAPKKSIFNKVKRIFGNNNR